MKFFSVVGLTFLAVSAAHAGFASGVAPADPTELSKARSAVKPVRQIEDPCTGDRWLLMRDAGHPGGPARLVRAESGQAGAGMHRIKSLIPAALPVIHAGDRVRLEEHTPVADAVFESTALGAALPGELVQVRLKIGGRVMRAVAISSGHAAIIAEARP